jgi:phosphoribosylformimino-5-aminoimidazole carboxamide ribotide isomerase
MKIIPVIDLKNGVVVHAKQGQRDHYQPIHTDLCRCSDIFHVLDAFLGLYAFDTFYIADLNAITGQGNHDALISDVLACFPRLNFWLDQGYRQYNPRLKYPGNSLPVLGSESYSDDNLLEIKAFDNNFILSLDYSAAHALGAPRIFSNQDYWPDNIIVMTLDRVGSRAGPDIEKLSAFCSQYPAKNFIAAGGIRHIQDLIDLDALGIKQALLASALHYGKINAADIANLQTKKYPGKPGYF